MRRLLVLALLAVGCFSDETQLTSGAVCRSGPGWYCGFDGVPGFADHLYYCPATATRTTMATDLGQCPAMRCSASGSATDACAGGVSRSSAFGFPGYGWWCGEAFSGGTPGHLFFFADGLGADLGACASGCVIAGKEQPDHCR